MTWDENFGQEQYTKHGVSSPKQGQALLPRLPVCCLGPPLPPATMPLLLKNMLITHTPPRQH